MQVSFLRLAYCLPPLLSGLAAAMLAVVIWRRRPSQPAATLGLYLLSVAVWSISYACQLMDVGLVQKIFWAKVEYLGPAGVSLAGLIFVLQYSGLNEWVRRWPIVWLLKIPAITQVLVWTNERHHLVWRQVWMDFRGPFPMMARAHGTWFWIFLGYSYLLCAASVFLLVREFFSRKGIYRSQTGVLLLGSLVPLAGNCLYAFGIEIVPNLDLTVMGFFVTGLSMAWGLFRFQLPVIMPLARQTVFEGMSDGVVALDTSGNVIEVNPEAVRIVGESARSLIGRPAMSALRKHPELVSLCAIPRDTRVEVTLDSAGSLRRFDVRCSLLRTPKQRVVGSLIVLRDITEREAAEAALRQAHAALEQRIAERTADLSGTIEELRQVENQLTVSASHDSLTQLPNRALFLANAARHLAALEAGEGKPFAVLYLDIDHFKVYNDGYGHHVGDLILCEMGRRLRACLQPHDTVARMGGDEFTILLHEVANAADASRMAEKCLVALAAPAYLEGISIDLTASIGLAVAVDGRSSAEDLVRDADLAMYLAKRQGGAKVEFFGESMRASALSLVELQRDLRMAVERGQITVYYQPFVRIETGTVVGFEALVRWNHPQLGLLQPAQFLPSAEQTGTLMDIDEFVLREACRQRDCWEALMPEGVMPPFVSVNVAGWQFFHPQRWWRVLAEIAPRMGNLRLEMMESVLVTNAHASAEFFERVRAHHLEIYLDDFGTGFSSLSWLSHFPIRSLKIDKSFVKEIETGDRAASIVPAIIALARVLEMDVVAEGVETEQQAKILQEMGCEFGQGYLFSAPVDSAGTIALLSDNKAAKAAKA